MSDDANFLSRWSRRKTELKAGRTETLDPSPSASEGAVVAVAAKSAAPAGPQAQTLAPLDAPAPSTDAGLTAAPPAPTLADVALLTRDDSFARFVAPDVDATVRNAAMKKLFSDPHFNVMDGLDVYIDDYSKPDPIPLSMLRRMTQSQSLGLFDHEPSDAAGHEHPPAVAVERSGATPPIPPAITDDDAAPLPPVAEACADEDPDLQLQPDDGARRAGAGPSAPDRPQS